MREIKQIEKGNLAGASNTNTSMKILTSREAFYTRSVATSFNM
jgi:hypothetical protein